MKTNLKRWSRLLFVVITVLSLASMIFPSMVQAAPAPCDTCPSTSCNLLVNIVTPLDKATVDKGDEFWVNATVAMPLDVITSHSQIEGVLATLHIQGPAVLVDCANPQGPVTLNSCNQVADFWWKLRCTDCGPVVLDVCATSDTPCNQGYYAGTSKTVTVEQTGYVGDPKIVIDIIECPDAPVAIGSDFAVKAYVHNVTDQDIDWVTSCIKWTGPAQLNPSNPGYWNLSTIRAGCYLEVGWSLRCTGGGDVVVTIDGAIGSNGNYPATDCTVPGNCPKDWQVQEDTCTVHQICNAAIGVTVKTVALDANGDVVMANGKPVEITEIGANCNNTFRVIATVCDTCDDTDMRDIFATLSFSGQAVVKNNGSLQKTVCPLIEGGDCEDVYWDLVCTGAGAVTGIAVTVNATDAVSGQAIGPVTSTPAKSVNQLDTLMVSMLSPANGTKYNVCTEFDVVSRIYNVSPAAIDTTVVAGLDLTNATNVALANNTVHIVYADSCNRPSKDVTATPGTTGIFTAFVDCICKCGYVDVTWHLKCIASDLEDCNLAPPLTNANSSLIRTFAAVSPTAAAADDATVRVQQMCKAHLSGTLSAYKGTLTDGNFEGCQTISEIAVGQTFTVVAAVGNLGEATANNVNVTLGITGSATTQDPLTQIIPSLGCHGASKVIWELTCTGPGQVRFCIDALSGTDANYNAAVPAANIDKGCPLTICQIPLTATIIQPLTGTDFIVGDNFTVKAKICNTATGLDTNCDFTLDCLFAKLHWPGEYIVGDSGNGSGYHFGCMSLAQGQEQTIALNTLGPGQCAEVTWEVQCCGAGDVPFWVEVFQTQGSPCSVENPEILSISTTTQTVHQFEAGGIGCYIVSPQLNNYDVCDQDNVQPDAMIGTGEVFNVSAKFFNTGDRPFTIDTVSVRVHGDGDAVVVSGPTPNPVGVELPKYDYHTGAGKIAVGWTLRGTKEGPIWIEVKVSGFDDMCTTCRRECFHNAFVYVYNAAFLDVDVTNAPTGMLAAGTDFTVTTKVTNIGQADASSVKLNLSVTPANNVTVTSGGYTKDVGSLYGHGNPANSAIQTWNLHINTTGYATLNFTASGNDEYGYQVKQICTSSIDWIDYIGMVIGDIFNIPGLPEGLDQITCCELVLDGTPQTPVPDGSGAGLPDGALLRDFVDEASVTVNGGVTPTPTPPTPGPGTVTVSMEAGWNLISMPWYVESANQSPSVIFAGIIGGLPDYNLNILDAYDACASSNKWDVWSPMGDPNPVTLIRDGKGYWISLDHAASLVLSGAVNPSDPSLGLPSYSVCAGWNLIGFKNGSNAQKIEDYLSGTNWVRAYTFDNGAWQQVPMGSSLQPGLGYWVAFSAPGTIYP